MSKSILLGFNNKLSTKANRWLFAFTSLLFLLSGAFHIATNNLEPFGLILGILLLIGGIYHAFMALFAFSPYSRFAPKVKVDESSIEIKNSVWKPGHSIKWEDLSAVKFQPFEIIFDEKGSSLSFPYKANPEVSLSIKQSIREVAERKNIEVIGG